MIDITRFDRGLEQLGRRFGQRLDLSFHVRPAGKAVSARNHKLGIAQDKIFWCRGLRVQRAYSLDRFRFAAPIVAREGLGEPSLLVQVRIGGKRANEALGAVPSFQILVASFLSLPTCTTTTYASLSSGRCGPGRRLRWSGPQFPPKDCGRSGHDVAAADIDAGGSEGAVRLLGGGAGRDGGTGFKLAPVGDLQT